MECFAERVTLSFIRTSSIDAEGVAHGAGATFSVYVTYMKQTVTHCDKFVTLM